MHGTVTAAVGVALAGCSLVQPSHSVITRDADGMRTFTVIREAGGHPVACAAFGVPDPVTGTLEGDRDAIGDTVWLRSQEGGQVFVVWPAGFHVGFEPSVTLHDETGRVVGKAGEAVELSQVQPDSHAGTAADPYIAAGILFGGCYPFVP